MTLRDTITMAGTLSGLILGTALISKYGWLHPATTWKERATRVVAGAAGVGLMAVVTGAGVALAGHGSIAAELVRYVGAGCGTFWAVGLAPMAFVRLRLGTPE